VTVLKLKSRADAPILTKDLTVNFKKIDLNLAWILGWDKIIVQKSDWRTFSLPTASGHIINGNHRKMTERLRFEPLEEWFFPAPVFEDGYTVPASPEAIIGIVYPPIPEWKK